MSTRLELSEASRDLMNASHSKSTLGFWVYIMTDCVLFATLLATYVVFDNAESGVSAKVNLPLVLIESSVLLLSSLTCGIASIAFHAAKIKKVVFWLGITCVLGLGFLGLEVYEFRHLINEGYSWHTGAHMSAYFALIGTHGIHIIAGIIWLAVLIFRLKIHGISKESAQKLTTFSLFWHFLDVVWIFIFSVVYMLGAL